MTFVFLHVGDEAITPTYFVKSIRQTLPEADVIQCTDEQTPEIEGVTRVCRYAGDSKNLMTFRLLAFSSLNLEGAVAYTDTDMLMIRPIDPEKVLGDYDVAVCERSFDRERIFNKSFRNMDFSEHRNKTMAEAYPYLACFTAVRGNAFWQDCYDELQRLPTKFHSWYGDQEAIRNIVARGAYRIKTVPEGIYGCLPDYLNQTVGSPRMLHFKGEQRKKPMLQYAKRLGLG